MTPAAGCHATLGESIVRHPASAGCCVPFRFGVSATLTLAPGPPGVATPIGAWPSRLTSRMVTADREVAREIRLM